MSHLDLLVLIIEDDIAEVEPIDGSAPLDVTDFVTEEAHHE